MVKNKVEFGMKQVHVGTFELDEKGVVTLGAPMHIPGAVSLALNAETEESEFFADDIVYFGEFNNNGYTGDLNMALFPDDFKLAFLNYIKLADGGVAEMKNKKSKKVYFMFQGDGDASERRHIIYNVGMGAINREHRTKEGTKTPETETLPVTITGDNETGIIKVSYNKDDAGYETLFTTPPVPKVPTEHAGTGV